MFMKTLSIFDANLNIFIFFKALRVAKECGNKATKAENEIENR